MIDTWGFYFFTSGGWDPDNLPSEEEFQHTYNKYLELWTACEEYGLSGVAFAEHHFNPISLSPSTHLIIAAVAARTSTLRLATLGSVLPLNDARRFAEEVGMLDYLTNGRFEPGIAPGAGFAETAKAGLPDDQVRPRYYSGAEVLRKAVEDRYVTHHDEFYNLERVAIVPTIRKATGRNTWATVMSPQSAVWTAERGYKLCTSWLSVESATALAETYRTAADAAGHSTDPSMLGLRRRVFVAATDVEARDKYESCMDFISKSAGTFETADPVIGSMFMNPDDFAIGSPTTVADKLVEQCRAGGYGNVFAFTDFARFEHTDLVRSHELLGKEVAPILRSADVGAPTSNAAVLA